LSARPHRPTCKLFLFARAQAAAEVLPMSLRSIPSSTLRCPRL
jgi:hypothetical protein